jgi:hypothetical protein
VFDLLHICVFLFGHLLYMEPYLARNLIYLCSFFVVVSGHSDLSKSTLFFSASSSLIYKATIEITLNSAECISL